MQGRLRRCLVLAASACAASALAASGAQASEQGCVDAAPDGSREIKHSDVASVIKEPNGRHYGCLFDNERLHKLPGQDVEHNTKHFHVQKHALHVVGRRAAYVTKRTVHFDGETFTEVFVYSAKLWSSREWAHSDERDDIDVNKLLLRSNGATAWLWTWRGNDQGSPFTALWTLQHRDGGPKQVEIANDEQTGGGDHPIDKTFLRFAGDDHSVVEWRRVGEDAESFELR